MLGSAPTRLTSRRRVLTTGSLGPLGLSHSVMGLGELLAPRHFFDAFPAGRHAWGALLPPYTRTWCVTSALSAVLAGGPRRSGPGGLVDSS